MTEKNIEKARAVHKDVAEGSTVAQATRKHDMPMSQYYRWKADHGLPSNLGRPPKRLPDYLAIEKELRDNPGMTLVAAAEKRGLNPTQFSVWRRNRLGAPDANPPDPKPWQLKGQLKDTTPAWPLRSAHTPKVTQYTLEDKPDAVEDSMVSIVLVKGKASAVNRIMRDIAQLTGVEQ